MSERYVIERCPRWSVAGRSYGGGGLVTIVNSNGHDVIHGIPVDLADELVAARAAYLDALVVAFGKYPDACYRLTGPDHDGALE